MKVAFFLLATLVAVLAFINTSESLPIRDANDDDYRSARNAAIQVFRDMDYYFANHWENRTYIQEKLLPIFQEIYTSDAIVSLSYPPNNYIRSDPGPEGILNFAFGVITNKGEIHVFGQFMEWQIREDDDIFYKYPFIDNPFVGVKRPVRILLNSVNTDVIGLVNDTEHFTEFRTEKTWIVDVNRCSLIGNRRVSKIREIKMEILATLIQNSAPSPAWRPIDGVDVYKNEC